jgi:hypothetical protein
MRAAWYCNALVGLWWLLGPPEAPARAQGPISPAEAAQWRFDRVLLKGGGALEGIIERETSLHIELLEVRRPPGKPLQAVKHIVARRDVAQIDRLGDQDRAALRDRLQQYRNRAAIEAGRMEDVELRAIDNPAAPLWQYSGEWFDLESTADEETTRRSVVRLEQVFAAYRQMLPPRKPSAEVPTAVARPVGQTPPEPALRRDKLGILLWGSTDEYRAFLRRLGAAIENPAFFASDANIVVAASDLTRLATELQRAKQQHDLIRERLREAQRTLSDRLRVEGDRLRAAGYAPADVTRALRTLRSKWQSEIDELQRQITQFDRQNEALFDRQTRQLFATLYHEAFHAYLENYVYPQAEYDVPRWLNEGLAQIFEAGLLEAGVLRVDAPEPRALAFLKDDLQRAPLPLAELLTADHRAFLVPHGGSGATSARHYAYSFGVAYYLTFERGVLGSTALDEFVRAEGASGDSPIRRFEKLVRQPLPEFERQWREYILNLSAPRR